MSDIPRIELHESLGAGSFGEVFRAHMITSGGVRLEVAVKLLQLELDPRTQALERLLDEGRLLGMLDHPAILKVHDLVRIEDRVGLVTEYIDGQDLESIIRMDGMPLRPLIETARQIASAISCAWHTDAPDGSGPLHLVHRDIKPANIRIGKHGQPKLLDFGVAKAIHIQRDTNTNNESMIGSYLYMPPERLTRTEGHSNAGDLYALGAVMYEAIKGRALFADLSLHEQFLLAWDAHRHNEFVGTHLNELSTESSVRSLIEVLLRHQAKDRGQAQDVVRRCDALDERLTGARLRSWCRKRSWPSADSYESDLGSRTITESVISGDNDPGRFRRGSTSEHDFVGRSQEMARMLQLMSPGLTLIHGPGGIGKSRLAREQCPDTEHHFFVSLEQTQTGSELIQAVAAAIGVPLASPEMQGQLEQLGEAITARRLRRLALDNLEQLEPKAYEAIEGLHQRSPETCFLMTSRLDVPLSGVRVLALGPLKPEPGLQLYLQRARAVDPTFQANAVDQQGIRDFVGAVGGMPLAIELAASRCRVLPPSELKTWGKHGTIAGKSPQHTARSIEECLDVSWNLLTEQQRLGWLTTAHFAGSFTTTAWAEVSGISNPLDVLDQLISHSLVLAPSRGQKRRFNLMPPIRAYLTQRLASHPSQAKGKQAHCRYYADLARRKMPRIRTTEHLVWAELERANLTRATQQATEEDPINAGFCLCSMSQLIQDRGPTSLMVELGVPILGRLPDEAPLGLRNMLETQIALAHARLGQRAQAKALSQSAYLRAVESGSLREQADCLHAAGVIAYLSGEPSAAIEKMKVAAEIALAAGNSLTAGLTLYNMASLLELKSQRTQALTAAHRAAAHLNECEASVPQLGAFTLLAALEMQSNDLIAAERAIHKGQALRDIPVGRITILFETNRALLLLRQNRPQDAIELLETQFQVSQQIGLADARAAVEWAKGLALYCLGDLNGSQIVLEQSRQTYARSQQHGEACWIRVLIGAVMRLRGEAEASDYELRWAAQEALNSQSSSRTRVLETAALMFGEDAPGWLTDAVAAILPHEDVPLSGPVAELLQRARETT